MIDTTAHKEFGNSLLKEIRRVVDDTGRLTPENFNVLSRDIALDYSGIPVEIPVSGLACINSVDYQKMRDIAMFLKANRTAYVEKKIVIEPQVFAGEELLETEEGSYIANRNGLALTIKTPQGFDGRRALITWLIAPRGGTLDNGAQVWQASKSQMWWVLSRQLIGGEQGAGIMVYPQAEQIKIKVEYNRSGDNELELEFPGMTVFVKYHKGAA